jgi:serine/threonine protein kinase SCH9
VLNTSGCLCQLLNRNPKHRLGAQRDAAELKEHPFFSTIDWDALARKQVTPPFKPIVESDESTANFDPEFTSADISHIDLADKLALDDDDPSEAWVSQSVSGGQMYTPHGPLGSDRPNASTTPRAIMIEPKNRGPDRQSSPPLTNSVQDHFRGFTYSGESESLIARAITRLNEKDENREEDTVADDDATYPTTDDEVLDVSRHGGRYSKRHGYVSGFDEDLNL